MIEDVIEGIKAILISDMNNQVAILNTEFTDFAISSILEGDIHTSEKSYFSNYPSIIIMGDRTSVIHHMSVKDLSHSIILSCSVRDQDEEVLTRKIYRYLKVVERILENNNFLKEFNTTDGVLTKMIIKGYRYSPMFMKEDENDFKKDFVIHFEASERVLIGA